MNIYVFGNPDLRSDNKAFEVVENIKDDYPKIKFIIVKISLRLIPTLTVG